jgi:hypothetical protein
LWRLPKNPHPLASGEGVEKSYLRTLFTASDSIGRRGHLMTSGPIEHVPPSLVAKRAENLARARELLLTPPSVIPIDAIKAINSNPETRTENNSQEAQPQKRACPCCGGQMTIIESFARGTTPRHQPSAPVVAIRIDTS